MSLFDVDIYFRQRPLHSTGAKSVLNSPCLKQPRFAVGEAATSFQDVHAVFQRVPHAMSSHKNKIDLQKNSAAPVPNFYRTATGRTGIFLLRLTVFC